MPVTSPFQNATHYLPRGADTQLPGGFGDIRDEYVAANEDLAVFDRSTRCLIEVTGHDRQTWLHNLITNNVKTLAADAGVYAFACDVKGRAQFDLNVLNLDDRLWLDVDAADAEAALRHLDLYLITEDAQLRDISGDYARLACCGQRAAEVATALGAPALDTMAALAHAEIPGGGRLIRHDFVGIVGFEVIIGRSEAAEWWDRMVDEFGATPAGVQAAEVLRVEAGLPARGREITGETLPPETGQIARGVSYHKGCYLGQEIIERMRSRGVMARRLARLNVDGVDAGVSLPAELSRDGKAAGRLTSLVQRPTDGQWLGLGYVKSGVEAGAELALAEAGGTARVVEIVER